MKFRFLLKAYVFSIFFYLPAVHAQTADQLLTLYSYNPIVFAIFPSQVNIDNQLVPLTHIKLALIDPNSPSEFQCIQVPRFRITALQFRTSPASPFTSIALFRNGNQSENPECKKSISTAEKIFGDAKIKGRWIDLPEAKEMPGLKHQSEKVHYASSIEDFFKVSEQIYRKEALLPNSIQFLENFYPEQSAYYHGNLLEINSSLTFMKHWNPNLIQPSFVCIEKGNAVTGYTLLRLEMGRIRGHALGSINIGNIPKIFPGSSAEDCEAEAKRLNKIVIGELNSAKSNDSLMEFSAQDPFLTEIKNKTVLLQHVTIPNDPSLLKELSK